MKKILNHFFSILQFVLWILSFFMTLYITVYMYQRLEKSMFEAFPILLPFVLVLIFYFINIIFRQKFVLKSLFYHITSCLVFLTIIFVCYRALFDTNMILNERLGYHINFNYFADFLAPMKIMLYGLCIVNLMLMMGDRVKKEVLVPLQVEEKEEKEENVIVVSSKSSKTSSSSKQRSHKKSQRRH